MSVRMKKYVPELKFISVCKPSTRKILFKHGDSQFISAIVDAIWTTLAGKVPLTKKQKSKIQDVQGILRRIVTERRTVKQRRRLLASQRGGNAVTDLISIIKDRF